MKTNICKLFCLVAFVLLIGCTENEIPIVPTSSETILTSLNPKYKLPEGTNAWDNTFLEIEDKYKILVVYKNADPEETLILSPIAVCTLYTEEDGAKLMELSNFLTDKFLKYIDTDKMSIYGLPQYILLLKELFFNHQPPFSIEYKGFSCKTPASAYTSINNTWYISLSDSYFADRKITRIWINSTKI